MAKTRKPKNTTTQQYNKLRAALRRQVRSMEKRGYFWRDQVIPDKPKKITTASVRRLQKVKESLYETARYRLPSGEETGGRYARDFERRQAAKKAAQTRKNKRLPRPDVPATYYPQQYDIYIDRLMKIINDIQSMHPQAGGYLQDLINKEITADDEETARLQMERIARQIENAGVGAVEALAVQAFYNGNAPKAKAAAAELQLILSGGEIPTAEQLQEQAAIWENEEGFLEIDDSVELLFE